MQQTAPQPRSRCGPIAFIAAISPHNLAPVSRLLRLPFCASALLTVLTYSPICSGSCAPAMRAMIRDQRVTISMDKGTRTPSVFSRTENFAVIQSADADCGGSACPLGALEAKVVHTSISISTFGVERVYHPLGRFDLSSAAISIHFPDTNAVSMCPALPLRVNGLAHASASPGRGRIVQ